MQVMKRILLAIFMFAAINAIAAEKKPIGDVDTDALTSETQSTDTTGNDLSNHITFVWWIPHQLWQATMAKEPKPSAAESKEFLDAFAGITVLVVAAIDTKSFGSYDYYSKDDIKKAMVVTYVDSAGEKHVLQVRDSIDKKVGVLLDALKPNVVRMLGKMGDSMQFFVLDDRAQSGKENRLIDPYREGNVDVQLTRKNNYVTHSRIDFPVNSLFLPRLCPGGRKADISWKYCPWDGSPLKD
jgi:hypothetical protein